MHHAWLKKEEDNLKNKDDLKNEDNLRNEDKLKNEDDLKIWWFGLVSQILIYFM